MSGRNAATDPRKGDRWQKAARGRVLVREVVGVHEETVTYRNQKNALASATLRTFIEWARYAVLTKEG